MVICFYVLIFFAFKDVPLCERTNIFKYLAPFIVQNLLYVVYIYLGVVVEPCVLCAGLLCL